MGDRDHESESTLDACVPMPHVRRVTIEVSDPLGPEEAERILAIVNSSDPSATVVLDVRAVTELEAYVLVQLVEALVDRQAAASFVGLPRHHSRILRYVGASLVP